MKKIHCENVCRDYIQVKTGKYVEGKKCSIDIHSNVDRIILDAKKIRKLRKQLKKALIEIEGVKEKTEWVPSPGDKVRFVNPETLDHIDKDTWHPKEGEIYVVRHVYKYGYYEGFSLLETPENKHTCLGHGYKFRNSGFEPA